MAMLNNQREIGIWWHLQVIDQDQLIQNGSSQYGKHLSPAEN